MPLLYAQIAFATLGGWLVFRHVPDGWAWLGMAMIAVCGAATRLAQRARERARAASMPADRGRYGARLTTRRHVAVLRGPPRQPAAAAAEAGRADPARRRHRRGAHRFELRAGVPPRRQGRGRAAAPHPRGRRQAPPHAAVPRPERTGQLCARRQPAVPAAQARHAGAVHLHPRSHQGSAAPRRATRQRRTIGLRVPDHRVHAGAAGDARPAAAGDHADRRPARASR